MSIAENIARVQEQIEAAARRANRSPQETQLIAVSKTVSAERIREACQAGVRYFGENRVQEFESKAAALRDLRGVQWRMIGHLQSNKSGRAVELFDAVDSVDSLRLAHKLNASAHSLEKRLTALVEINIGGEQAKSGLAPDSAELNQLLETARELPALDFRGLMAVPPYSDDPENSRPYFRKMKELFDEIARRKLPAVSMETLSMGMSHDFVVAIEEGATCVRLGTAIFGKRPALRSRP